MMKKRNILTWGLLAVLATPVGALASGKGSDDSNSSSSSGSGSSDSGGGTSGHDDNNADDHGVDTTADDHGIETSVDDRSVDTSKAPASVANFAQVDVPLAPTSAGSSLKAHGHVDIRVEGAKQRIEVELEADLSDGTVVNILINGAPAGTATIRLQEAEFEFETEGIATLPGGILPGDVTSVAVTDAGGNVLVQAQFGALGNGSPTPVSSSTTLVSKKIDLTPNAAAPFGAKAVAELRVRSVDERFKLQVEANVPHGTVWKALANGFPIGNLTFKLHHAELQLETGATLPVELPSLSAITTAAVTAADGTVLFNGTF